MKKTKKATIVLAVLTPVVLYVLAAENRSPFDEVKFIEDYPGASDRHVVFTPVLRKKPYVVIGEPVGADYGAVRYRDCDGDGINEAIIETDKSELSAEYRTAVRHVYKYQPDSAGNPRVKLISSQRLSERNPDAPQWSATAGDSSRFCEP